MILIDKIQKLTRIFTTKNVDFRKLYNFNKELSKSQYIKSKKYKYTKQK